MMVETSVHTIIPLIRYGRYCLDVLVKQPGADDADRDGVDSKRGRVPERAERGAPVAALDVQPSHPSPQLGLEQATDDVVPRRRCQRVGSIRSCACGYCAHGFMYRG